MSINEFGNKWYVLAGVAIASFLGCIDFTIVNTALPTIQTDLKTSLIQLQWIMNIFVIALSAFMVAAGRFADLRGRRYVLCLGMLIFGVASLGAGFADTAYTLIFFRFFQGLSCAIFYTVTTAIVTQAFPEHERGKALGLLFGINGLGLASGPVIGGFILNILSWRWIFFLNIPFLIISYVLCLAYVRESRAKQTNRIDWMGLILLIIALPCLVLAITQGNIWGWTSWPTLICFAIPLTLGIIFYQVEKTVDEPVIDLSLFLNRHFIAAALSTFALAFFYCTAFFLMPLFLKLRGNTPYQIGLLLLPATLGMAILSPFIGNITHRNGTKLLFQTGLGLFALSALMQVFLTWQTPVWYTTLAFLCMGAGWACLLSPSMIAATLSVPENQSAVAIGSVSTIHNIGGATGLALSMLIYHFGSVVPSETPAIEHFIFSETITPVYMECFLAGYHAVMQFLAMVCLSGLFFLGVILKKPSSGPIFQQFP